ncbi:hypothetical protein [Pseudomonas moraviensis]|uniref:hypothetical protein n=1 Tax=Pseudomonas moraviensis TaxID=321662 RepID=UPI00093574EC|nr:hypothetical protein [Pseudomonas moraviensis]OJT50035.1 hypothetical protein BSZ28_18565 [Pseudomonas moraviensis]
MTSNFKPGDLALIINSAAPKNIGKTVRLVEYIAPNCGSFMHEGVCFKPREVPTWIVESLDGSKSLFGGYIQFEIMVRSGPCRQQWLMPLRGDFTPEQQKAKEAEPCA